ncbi:glycoprotein [paper mulberry mosaic associated virus]|uniref:Glycoprotein n=1 Tax=paper mulberry mosaic associated virus TaxID=3071215 RepID=A0AAE7JKJ3_9RHAB|nr:glycoprotein [paper mulberry mosaic associated virus]QNO38994.1 glycoprotein [paper mulberry mosaic associated virus]
MIQSVYKVLGTFGDILQICINLSRGEEEKVLVNIIITIILFKMAKIIGEIKIRYLLLLLAVISFYTRSVQAEISELHLPPVVKCNEKIEIGTDLLLPCLDRCNVMYSTEKVFWAGLYKYTGKNKVQIGICKKKRITKVAEETWTFSNLHIQESEEYLPVNQAECKSEWKEKCDMKECITSPKDWAPEYHWASETKETRDFIFIDSTHTGYKEWIDGKFVLITSSFKADLSSGWSLSKDGKTGYMWSTEIEKNDGKCKWELSDYYDCYNDKNNDLICPSLGETLKRNSPDIKVDNCPDIYGSTRANQLYRIMGDDFKPKKPPMTVRLLTLGDSSSKTDLAVGALSTFVNLKMQQECIASCYEVKVKKMIPQMMGNQLISATGGELRYCSYDPFCKIQYPLTTCADKEDISKIKVDCESATGWWDLNSTVMLTHDSCHAINKKYPLKLKTWHGKYLINQSGIYHVDMADRYSYPNVVPSLKISIKQKDVFNHGFSDVMVRDSSIVDPQPPEITGVQNPLKMIKGFISEISHKIKVYIFTGIVLIISSCIIVAYIKKIISRIEYRQVNNNNPGWVELR